MAEEVLRYQWQKKCSVVFHRSLTTPRLPSINLPAALTQQYSPHISYIFYLILLISHVLPSSTFFCTLLKLDLCVLWIFFIQSFLIFSPPGLMWLLHQKQLHHCKSLNKINFMPISETICTCDNHLEKADAKPNHGGVLILASI